MPDWSVVLGIIAGAIFLLAYGMYFRALMKSRTTMYVATWILLAFISLASCITYLDMTKQDVVKSIIPIGGAVCGLAMLVVALRQKSVGRWQKTDKIAFVIGIIACLVWWLGGKADWANWVAQGAIFVAFLPTFAGVLRTRHEDPWPWALWAISQMIAIVVLILRWDQDWGALVSPIVFIVLDVSLVLWSCWVNRHGE